MKKIVALVAVPPSAVRQKSFQQVFESDIYPPGDPADSDGGG